MVYTTREYTQLQKAGLAVSLVAWGILLLRPVQAASWCCGGDCLTPVQTVLAWDPPFSLVVRMVMASYAPGSLAGDWALMLPAMMTPTLIPPLYHIRISSFARRRGRSTILFAIGYGLVWMAAGAVLLLPGLLTRALMPQSWLPALCAAAVAVVWQATPVKQRSLNRAHQHDSLAAFGTAADRDAFRLGIDHGRWCVVSCWAAMLVPTLLPHGHMVGMLAVGLLMFCERLDPPAIPAWRLRGFRTAFRYVVLQWKNARIPAAQNDMTQDG